MLFEWRNDPFTRNASHKQDLVTHEEHKQWLIAILEDRTRHLYVVEEDRVPIGTVRADLSDGVHKLSWTVAPHARGRGLGKRMVALLATQIDGPIRAEIKVGNTASARIAEYAGMQFVHTENGVMHYQRPLENTLTDKSESS